MSIWDEVDALDAKIKQEESGVPSEEPTVFKVVQIPVKEEIKEEAKEIYSENNDYSLKIERVEKKVNSKGIVKGIFYIACAAIFTITVIFMVVTISQSGSEVKEMQNEMDYLFSLKSHSIKETNLSGGVALLWDKVIESE